MEIGKQIKKYRTEMKLSQEELAEKIFVSRQTISNWENNKNYPDVKSLLLLSSLFSVSLDILIKGDLEEMKEKIKTEDIDGFKHDGNIFSMLMLCTILLPIPLARFMGYVGFGILCLIIIATYIMLFELKSIKRILISKLIKKLLLF